MATTAVTIAKQQLLLLLLLLLWSLLLLFYYYSLLLLALDLQTRLDDKEFNAKSITQSFKSFKKEILLKAENSRTGKEDR